MGSQKYIGIVGRQGTGKSDLAKALFTGQEYSSRQSTITAGTYQNDRLYIRNALPTESLKDLTSYFTKLQIAVLVFDLSTLDFTDNNSIEKFKTYLQHCKKHEETYPQYSFQFVGTKLDLQQDEPNFIENVNKQVQAFNEKQATTIEFRMVSSTSNLGIDELRKDIAPHALRENNSNSHLVSNGFFTVTAGTTAAGAALKYLLNNSELGTPLMVAGIVGFALTAIYRLSGESSNEKEYTPLSMDGGI